MSWFTYEKVDFRKSIDVATRANSLSTSLDLLGVSFQRMADETIKTTEVFDVLATHLSGPPRFGILDWTSDDFAKHMVHDICTRYGIPPCDEVHLEVSRNPMNRLYTVAVTLFHVTRVCTVAENYLQNARDPASDVARKILARAAECWAEATR